MAAGTQVRADLQAAGALVVDEDGDPIEIPFPWGGTRTLFDPTSPAGQQVFRDYLGRAASAGLSGLPLTHSDVGGYTVVGNTRRDYELWARWLELEAFTPLLRTHHSSAPEVVQWHSDERTLALFGRYGRWHQRLAPYWALLAAQAAADGTPVAAREGRPDDGGS